jgi:hypothetical protein
MRPNSLKFAGVILLAVLSLGVVSSARASSRFRGVIPFDFTIGNATLPAGAYTLSEISPGVLVIRNETFGQNAAIVFADSSQVAMGHDSVELIFRRSGYEYFLGQAQTLDGSKNLSARQAPSAFQEVLAVCLRKS